MAAKLNKRIVVSPDVISQEIQLGESLLLDVKNLTYFGLDSLGTRVWAALQSCDDADSLIRRVADTNEQQITEIEARIHSILHALAASKLISLEPANTLGPATAAS